MWGIRHWRASLNVHGQQPSLTQTGHSGAVCFFLSSAFLTRRAAGRAILLPWVFSAFSSVFLWRLSQESSPGAVGGTPFLALFRCPRFSLGAPGGGPPVPRRAVCSHMPCSDIRLGVPLSSSSETHPGGCWRVAGRTEEGTCPPRRALCVALTAAAAAARTGAASPAAPSVCTGCFPALGLGVRARWARSCPHVQWAPDGVLPLRSAGSGAVQAGRGLMPALPRASCHRVPDVAHLLGVLVCLFSDCSEVLFLRALSTSFRAFSAHLFLIFQLGCGHFLPCLRVLCDGGVRLGPRCLLQALRRVLVDAGSGCVCLL